MTREEFYNLTDILNTEVLGNFMHGGEADELIAMFEEAVDHSNILEQEEPVSDDLEEAAKEYSGKRQDKLNNAFIAGAQWQIQKDSTPVSEELQEAANAYISNEINYSQSRTDTFKAGAQWQKEQMKEALRTEYEKGRHDALEEIKKSKQC